MGQLKDLFNIFKLTRALGRVEFIRHGLCNNKWVWLHMLIGGLLARALKELALFSNPMSLLVILAIAVGFEIVEAYIETPNRKMMAQIYGSKKIYIFDTIGDVLGAVGIAALILF